MIRAWSSRSAGASLSSRAATSVPMRCFLSSSLHSNGMGSCSCGSRRKYGHHADASPFARSYITAKMSAASSRSSSSSSGMASETEPVRGVRHQAFGISTSTSPTRTSADANAALLTRVEPGGVTSRSSRASCSTNPRSTHHFSNAASEPASPSLAFSSSAAAGADVALARLSAASAAAGALARLRDLGGMRALALHSSHARFRRERLTTHARASLVGAKPSERNDALGTVAWERKKCWREENARLPAVALSACFTSARRAPCRAGATAVSRVSRARFAVRVHAADARDARSPVRVPRPASLRVDLPPVAIGRADLGTSRASGFFEPNRVS